jgi:mono/diheme cytochrome c family protein
MGRVAKIVASGAAALAAAVAISACGSQGIAVSSTSQYHQGAVLFLDHCSGCHTLSAVGAEGSATSVQNRLRTNAPNFNYRAETVQNVLYAIENGGFSGQIMPENIVVGSQALAVARFLAHYAGRDAPKTPTLPQTPS